MARPMVIRVAKTPKSAYNPHRNASSLLLTQVAQIEKARQLHPHGHRVTMVPGEVRTEGEAAAFIGQVTRLLHPAGAAPEPPREKRPARKRKVAKVKRRHKPKARSGTKKAAKRPVKKTRKKGRAKK
jgi:hypothetical protein